MLTIKQLRKLDRCPSDKSLVASGREAIDCGEWWSNGFVAFREALPAKLTSDREADISAIVPSDNTRQVWPTRIQPGIPRTQTRLDGHEGKPLWVNTKYLLAAAKKGRNACTFWAGEMSSSPLVCKDRDGATVALIMSLVGFSTTTPPEARYTEWWLRNLDLPPA